MLISLLTKRSWPAIGILVISLFLTVVVTAQIKSRIDSNAHTKFNAVHSQVVVKIQERVSSYALMLRGAAGLFAGSDTVTRADWKNYYEMLDPKSTIPNIQGIGFSRIIESRDLAAHTQTIRNAGFPNYEVRPSTARDIYTSIIYLEPFSGRNLRAFGYDMFSEPIRHHAMEEARDFNEVVLSGKVELVQDDVKSVQAGTLMYFPVYNNKMLAGTVEQRRANLIGWVYIPFRMTDLMSGILDEYLQHDGKLINVHVYDSDSSNALLFDSANDNSVVHASDPVATTHLKMFSRNWTIQSFPTHSSQDYTPAWTTAVIGTMLSIALYFVTLLMHQMRITAAELADKLTENIRSRNTQLADYAYYDTLTHLPNRRMLADRLNQLPIESCNTNLHSALMFLDLDNFKPLNDTYGHEVGDMLLMEAATRLRASVREIDTVARIGGDEFVVLLKDVGADRSSVETTVTRIANKILNSMSHEYYLQSQNSGDEVIKHTCTASIGITVFTNVSVDTIELTRQADSAMYSAKQSGRNTIKFYEEQL